MPAAVVWRARSDQDRVAGALDLRDMAVSVNDAVGARRDLGRDRPGRSPAIAMDQPNQTLPHLHFDHLGQAAPEISPSLFPRTAISGATVASWSRTSSQATSPA